MKKYERKVIQKDGGVIAGLEMNIERSIFGCDINLTQVRSTGKTVWFLNSTETDGSSQRLKVSRNVADTLIRAGVSYGS